jgi:hypothetical protein
MPSPPDAFECKQIFIAHQVMWDAMELWAKVHGFHLDLIPTTDADGNLTLTYGPDDTPTYAFMPRMPGDKR